MADEWSIIEDELLPLIGAEHELRTVNGALKAAAQRIDAPAVGAMQIRCSDEAEREGVDEFQADFAEHLLPSLKPAHRAPFATASLGGQFEPGSLRVAEANFATPASREAFKLMVVRVAAHVGVGFYGGERIYGELRRYEIDKPCCGLLTAVVVGGYGPSIERAAETLRSGGIDRLAMLRDEIEPRTRLLVAALVSARLQALAVVEEAHLLDLLTPTLFLVVPTVTLNKPDRDNEVVCGVHLIDRRVAGDDDLYQGLGDRPTSYRVDDGTGQLRVTDELVKVGSR
jgi:hypothetical protein